MSKSILQIIYSCSVQKTAPKTTKYSTNKTILKVGHHVAAMAYANPHFGSKIKIPKNLSKYILQIIYTFSVKRPLQKPLIIPEMRPFWRSAIMQRL